MEGRSGCLYSVERGVVRGGRARVGSPDQETPGHTRDGCKVAASGESKGTGDIV